MLVLNVQQFAVPFHRVSKTRKRLRRSHNAITANETVKCPNCGEMIRPHRVCAKCGYYKGKDELSKKNAELM